jgi:hypothetical protein
VSQNFGAQAMSNGLPSIVDGEAPQSAAELIPVSDRLIHAFLDDLVDKPDLAAVAKRLRVTLVDDRVFTEAAIRSAIFPELDP